MFWGFKRTLCLLLIVVISAGGVPAVAAKTAASAALDAITCDKDYGFSYKTKATSKGLGTDALLFIGETVASKLIGKTVDWAADRFVSSALGIETFDVEASLKKAHGKLDGIKRLLDEMYQKLTAMDFRSTMQYRDQKYNELKPEVVSRMNSLMNAKTEGERQRIVQDWANKSMMGSSSGVTATTQWGNLISTPFAGYTYIQCYDGYAKAAFPWEHDGYDFREGARYADIALYIDASILTGLYYNLVVDGKIEGKSAQTEADNIKAFEDQVDEVSAYFADDKNQVVRNASNNRCQITGATGFSVYTDKTYKAYVWSDGEGMGRHINELLERFFRFNSRGPEAPVRSEYLKRLMEFYPGVSVGSIFRDKAGVTGISDTTQIVLDRESRLEAPAGLSPEYTILIKSIPASTKYFSSAGFTKMGAYKTKWPLNYIFMQWNSKENTDYTVVCTGDSPPDRPNTYDDLEELEGTIVDVSKNRLTIKYVDDEEYKFDISDAVIQGKCEIGYYAEVYYHLNGAGECIADRVWVDTPVTLLDEETVSGIVTKFKNDLLSVKGEDGKKYAFTLSFNTRKLGVVKKKTHVTVTYQPGDDGKLYVLDMADIDFTTPLFPFETLSMIKGASKKLKGLTDLPGTWTTEDETVAKIVKGQKLKAIGAGNTNLIFIVGNFADTVTYKGAGISPGDAIVIPVTVAEKGAHIKSLTVNPKKCTLSVGGTLKLDVAWKPKTATETTLVFESSDDGVAIVDGDGLVTGIAAGKATVTVTSVNGVKKSCVVNVE